MEKNEAFFGYLQKNQEYNKARREEMVAKAKAIGNGIKFAYNNVAKPIVKGLWKGINGLYKEGKNAINYCADIAVDSKLYEAINPNAQYQADPQGRINPFKKMANSARNAKEYRNLEKMANDAAERTGEVVTPAQVYSIAEEANRNRELDKNINRCKAGLANLQNTLSAQQRSGSINEGDRRSFDRGVALLNILLTKRGEKDSKAYWSPWGSYVEESGRA